MTAQATRLKIPEPHATAQVRADDGALLILRRHGNPDGPRLVMSHGAGLSADAYYPFWSLLSARFDLVLYDFRNHGWNPVGDLQSHNIQTFLRDDECVARGIDRHFGPKPKIGVFHSISALTAVLPGAERNGYSALVLFDAPIGPPGLDPGLVKNLEIVGRRLANGAERRQAVFETQEAFSDTLREAAAFRLLLPGAVEILAQTTLRRVDGAAHYELRCPPAFEARMYSQFSSWSTRVDLTRLRCPAKAIGADPVVRFSFLPSVDLSDILTLDYDFVPDTTHFMQLEQPEACVAVMLEFLDRQRLV